MRTFDYTDEKYFRLHACFLWTINDVPALVTCEDGVRKDIKHALLVKKIRHGLGSKENDLFWDTDVIFVLIIIGVEVDNMMENWNTGLHQL